MGAVMLLVLLSAVGVIVLTDAWACRPDAWDRMKDATRDTKTRWIRSAVSGLVRSGAIK